MRGDADACRPGRIGNGGIREGKVGARHEGDGAVAGGSFVEDARYGLKKDGGKGFQDLPFAI